MKLLSLTIGNVGISAPPGIPVGGLNDGPHPLTQILSTGVGILLVFAVIIALIYLVWGGYTWMTSGGDAAKVKSAQQHIIYAMIGLVVCFTAFIIVNLVGNFVQVNLFK